MTIKITLAKEPEEIDAIFELRYQLLSQVNLSDQTKKQKQRCYLNDEGRSLNRFDGFPTTSHIIVKDDEKVVGGLRFCLDSSVGLPADLVYKFREKLPYTSITASCDMYCVSKNYHNATIAQGLVLMASYIGILHKVTHIIAPINPAIAKLMQKIGCKIVDQEQPDPTTGLAIVPVILEISALEDFFVKFVKANKLDEFLGFYECIFYEEGDYIIRAGEHGDCMYVIAGGEANVMHPKKYKVIKSLKPGDIFGEIALLNDEGIRTANVVAKSSVRAMRLDKSTFMDYLFNHPEKAMEFMEKINKQTSQLKD